MKKKRLIGLALLAPLALLAGCGGTATVGFSPNWFYDNTVENITGKSEKLEYEVSFRPGQTEGISVSYDPGTYTTELTAETLDQNGTGIQVYRLHTEYAITGEYRNGVLTAAIDDSMQSDVWFTPARDGLRPIKSEKSVRATVPYARDTAVWYTTYEFTYDVSYTADLSEATYTLDITAPESAKSKKTDTVKLGFSETFLDNEQLVLALRGMNLSSSSLTPFVTLDPQTRKPVHVNLSSESVSTSVSYDNGSEHVEGTIDAVNVTVSYDMAQPGPARTFVYAARTDDASKKHRSVLLRFQNTVMYNLGVMTYTLKKATFKDR